MRVAAIFVAAMLSMPIGAQTVVTANLVANTPMTVSWLAFSGTTTSATHPAGILSTNGSIQASGPPTSSLSWVVPTNTFVGCELHSDQNPHTAYQCGCDADWTLSISGPANTRGHLHVFMNCAGDLVGAGDVRVDVQDDGVFEATSLGSFYGPSFNREWDLPVLVGPTPLPVRILHHVATSVAQGYQLTIRFVPWSPFATDLGSSCGTSEVGWYMGTPWPENHPYFLGAVRDPVGSKDRLVARGHGTLGVFVFSDNQHRLPMGSIGLPMGCDDLLAAPIAFVDGALMAPGVWQLLLPEMTPGSALFVQHASLGTATVGPAIRFGISNLVQLRY